MAVNHPSTGKTFLSPNLFNLITAPQLITVTTSLAQNPTVAISAVAEKLYGTHHGHEHHDLARDEKAEGTQGAGGLLEKLHLGGSGDQHSMGAEEGAHHHDGHVHNPAADQWETMRPLSGEELAQMAKCGNWGSAQPGELFLNVSAEGIW